MKKLFLLLLPVAAAVVFIGVVYWKEVPLLPARQDAFTLLYTGDVDGYVDPCG